MSAQIPIDPVAGFSQAARDAGLEIKGRITADGKIHRCEMTGDKKGKKNGWYVLFLDGVPAGSFGSWRTGQTCSWCAKSDHELSADEIKENKRRMAAARALREKEETFLRAAAKDKAGKIWERAGSVDAKHGYVVEKGIKPIAAKQIKAMIVLPVRDIEGDLHSLQFIMPDGSKQFLTGGRKKGCFNLISPDGIKDADIKTFYVVEGWATGCSVYAATGQPVAVCFDAGNLLPVCSALRGKYPDSKIVICADDDYQTDGNPGITRATEAAEAVGGFMVKPDFGDARTNGSTDFNDLQQHAGIDAVRLCLAAAYRIEPKKKVGRAKKGDSNLQMKGGLVESCPMNVYRIISSHPDWNGVIRYNEFTYAIDKVKPPPFSGGSIGKWGDIDTVRAIVWVNENYGFSPNDKHLVQGLELVADDRCVRGNIHKGFRLPHLRHTCHTSARIIYMISCFYRFVGQDKEPTGYYGFASAADGFYLFEEIGQYGDPCSIQVSMAAYGSSYCLCLNKHECIEYVKTEVSENQMGAILSRDWCDPVVNRPTKDNGYTQHVVTVTTFAYTKTELATLAASIPSAIEAITGFITEEESGSAQFEELPGVYAYFQNFRIRTQS